MNSKLNKLLKIFEEGECFGGLTLIGELKEELYQEDLSETIKDWNKPYANNPKYNHASVRVLNNEESVKFIILRVARLPKETNISTKNIESMVLKLFKTVDFYFQTDLFYHDIIAGIMDPSTLISSDEPEFIDINKVHCIRTVIEAITNKSLRRECRLTQEELAERIGVDKNTISKLKNDPLGTTPSLEVISKFQKCFPFFEYGELIKTYFFVKEHISTK